MSGLLAFVGAMAYAELAKADALVSYTGFAIVLFSGVAAVALFLLRGREPQATRAFRTWGFSRRR